MKNLHCFYAWSGVFGHGIGFSHRMTCIKVLGVTIVHKLRRPEALAIDSTNNVQDGRNSNFVKALSVMTCGGTSLMNSSSARSSTT
jgi:hypothetical protein